MTDKKPHKCPVCNGTGLVHNGFYNSIVQGQVTTDATPETCKTCNGQGIVWNPSITKD